MYTGKAHVKEEPFILCIKKKLIKKHGLYHYYITLCFGYSIAELCYVIS